MSLQWQSLCFKRQKQLVYDAAVLNSDPAHCDYRGPHLLSITICLQSQCRGLGLKETCQTDRQCDMMHQP